MRARICSGDGSAYLSRFSVLYESGVLVRICGASIDPDWICEALTALA